MEEESEGDPDACEDRIRSERGKDRGAADEEHKNVGDRGECDPETSLPHRLSYLISQGGTWAFVLR